MRFWSAFASISAALSLAGCSMSVQDGSSARPAMWEVTGPDGSKATLFGTIHALPDGMRWQSDKLEAAIGSADRIVVEVKGLTDPAATARTFSRLARSPGHPPLRDRIDPTLAPKLEALATEAGLSDGAVRNVETWAIAAMLAQVVAQKAGNEASNGVDRALLASAAGKPVEELEGAEAQLGIFDRLPEADQRDFLRLVVTNADESGEDQARLTTAWLRGDVATIEQEAQGDILADPELRAALLIDRNRAWADRLDAMMRNGARPFVAVGAAHLVGTDGLPALLSARGYKVTRIQ